MYVLLHGAIRNVGDYLIFRRARDLISTYRRTDDFVELPRWKPIGDHLDAVNSSEAVILCGGPAYGWNFYPDICPLTHDLTRIRRPIIPLGLGWSGKDGSEESFMFTEESEAALRLIHESVENSSVRDEKTLRILNRHGFDNVIMTGCPAWYHIPSVDKPFAAPSSIQRVVISSPARPENFPRAARLVRWVKKRFRGAQVFLVFHRGIWWERTSPKADLVLNPLLAAQGFLRGVKIIDAAYSDDKIAFYSECDLHIGFRVHAHIMFLSHRKPSILIHEDGRGAGQTATLQTMDVGAGVPDLIGEIAEILETHERNRYSTFEPTFEIMRRTHSTMKSFIESFDAYST